MSRSPSSGAHSNFPRQQPSHYALHSSKHESHTDEPAMLMLLFRVPFLYEQSFQWYESFNPLGELIDRPNPTPALDLLDQLITECAWPPHRIHLLGFAQGGSVAVEFAIRWWTRELTRAKSASSSDTDEGTEPRRLGSVITVSGPLLSYPTLSKPCPTPTLVFHRQPPVDDALPPGALTALKKAFTNLNEVKMQRGEGMPRSKEEWEPIMRFWSEHLGRRQVGEGLYEVMSGGVP